MSNTYLDWAKRNMTLNGFQGLEHQFIRVDCLEWLRRGGGGQRYGVIFLDPPSFSTSKRMEATLDLQRDHVQLIRDAVQLLEPDGVLIFSNNLRSFRMDTEALAELELEDVSRSTLPKDFERNPKIHNCWRIQRGGSG
jgi:23S rRNA (guanine2445-N2)-methyltransferase / 23S rRNA (guanine2069-N7)-methyltransferase